MLKASAQGLATRDRILDAAFETLRSEGFAQTSARAIARRGGFNQALIFYHFGTLDALLLAALERTSTERLELYRDAIRSASTVDELLAVAARAYEADRSSGHMYVVAQMVAGSVAR